MFLFIELTAIGVIIFIITAIAFAVAVRFFIDSKKSLQQYMATSTSATRKNFIQSTPSIEPRKDISKQKPAKAESASASELNKMREMLQQQQRQLESVIAQLKQPEIARSFVSEDKKVDDLNLLLDKKEAEIKSLRQQTDVTREMQSHFEELQNEVDFLQKKLHDLEDQAWQAKDLAIKTESLEQSQQHLERELLRKEEKLLELTAENQRLNSGLNTTEDKLQESNMQRMQLQKKVQFLEEMNNDMKQVSDTNRKLQNEIRRIGELESMLNLIMQERDELLRQRHK